jgi:hypothetical protein
MAFTAKAANALPSKPSKFAPPPLSLVPKPWTKEELALRRSSLFTLRVNPSQTTGPEYKFSIYHIDGTEDLRTVLNWFKDIKRVINGLHAEKAEDKVPLIDGCCSGAASAAFHGKLQKTRQQLERQLNAHQMLVPQQEGETPEQFEERQSTEKATIIAAHALQDQHVLEAVRTVIEMSSPYKALFKQKEWMRNHCRKPYEMKIRTFANHVNRINNDELPHLPPFSNFQKLDDDDLIALIRKGTPNKWKAEMIKMNFDHDKQSLEELIEFFERLENADEHESGPKVATTPKQDNHSKKTKPNPNPPKDKEETGKWCSLHKVNTHSDKECRDQLKGKKKANTWSGKANASKTYTKQELNMLIKKVITKEKSNWTKEANAKPAGKRKTEEANMLETNLTNTVDVDDIDSDATESEHHDSDDMNSTIAKELNNEFDEFNLD